MGNLISSIADFVQKIIGIGLISAGVLLFAAEVKLAVLKKASQGSAKLSTFTQNMTKSYTNY